MRQANSHSHNSLAQILKANFCPSILKVLLKAGAHIDAVSPAEVFLALAIGFPSSHILFTVNNATGWLYHAYLDTNWHC